MCCMCSSFQRQDFPRHTSWLSDRNDMTDFFIFLCFNRLCGRREKLTWCFSWWWSFWDLSIWWTWFWLWWPWPTRSRTKPPSLKPSRKNKSFNWPWNSWRKSNRYENGFAHVKDIEASCTRVTSCCLCLQMAQKAQETESILTADVSPFSSQGNRGNLDRRKSSRPMSEGTEDNKTTKLDTIEGMKVLWLPMNEICWIFSSYFLKWHFLLLNDHFYLQLMFVCNFL